MATSQIVWPLPVSCGDEAQASRILNEINRLAPNGRVRPFHNKCGTWFFTASLKPSQIQQLMGEEIGIKFIAPDVEMKDETPSPLSFQKREPDKLHVHRRPRIQKRVRPDYIHVMRDAAAHLAWISTPPNHVNNDYKFAYFDSVGDGATVYWIDRQFYLPNPDLDRYGMAQNRLIAEDISLAVEEWNDAQLGDHGGCMLSMIGGTEHGYMRLSLDRGDGPQLKIVKVNPLISSFFSGIGAIITELELRIERNERVRTYTVIGTALMSLGSPFGLLLQVEAAALFKMLTNNLEAIVVVSAGDIDNLDPLTLPATISQHPDIPIIVALGVDFSFYLGRAHESQYLTLNAPGFGTCKHVNIDKIIRGYSPAVATITALAADMLTRPKVRAKLFIDNPALAPDEQKATALLPVSAKIRDYINSKAYDRVGYGGHLMPQVRGVWTGLDPDVEDINEYMA